MLYLIVKALHIIFVVAWMAALLVYPRYKLHQLKSAQGEPLFDTMADAADRLKRIILTPSMLAVWVLGITLVVINSSIVSGVWFSLKLLLVLGLTGLHGYFVSMGRKINSGALGPDSARKLRMLNELPFILMIIIVFLVVLKP